MCVIPLPASGPDGAERRSPSSPAPRWLLGCRSAATRRCSSCSVICSVSIAVPSALCDDGCVARSRRTLCCCRRCRSRCARAAERRALKGVAASQVNLALSFTAAQRLYSVHTRVQSPRLRSESFRNLFSTFLLPCKLATKEDPLQTRLKETATGQRPSQQRRRQSLSLVF